MAEIEALSRFSDAPEPAVTRILYSATDLAARHYLRTLVEKAGFGWREDAIGNTFIGLFTAEEPTRFGLGCVGSRALAGVIGPSELAALRDGEGLAFDTVRQAAGFYGGLARVRLAPGHDAGFVELHVEQGPLLEAKQIPIGVVTAISASTTVIVTFAGDGGHAGTVLMADRRDPLPAAAELALSVERAAAGHPAGSAVATVSIFDVHPGASNSIPARGYMSIDGRDVDTDVRAGLLAEFAHTAQTIAAQRQLPCEFQIVNSDHALSCDPQIVAAASRAAESYGLAHELMVSRAYHDAFFMGRVCPVGMVFVPSRGGYSHRPEEYTVPEEIRHGVQVLASTLATLAM